MPAMSETTRISAPWEPERYELASAPVYRFDLDRRDFFKFLGAGVLVFSVLKQGAWSQESGRARARRGDSLPGEIDAWLHIGESGRVRVFTGKVEVGQNVRTSLSQGVAEELRLPVEQIDLVMGDTQLTPFDMGTFGSRTTPTMNLQLRKVSASARDLLIDLAAARWQIDRRHLVAADGKVMDSDYSHAPIAGDGTALWRMAWRRIRAVNRDRRPQEFQPDLKSGALIPGN
jgi:isoquinoline 1-oxidoreductase